MLQNVLLFTAPLLYLQAKKRTRATQTKVFLQRKRARECLNLSFSGSGLRLLPQSTATTEHGWTHSERVSNLPLEVLHAKIYFHTSPNLWTKIRLLCVPHQSLKYPLKKNFFLGHGQFLQANVSEDHSHALTGRSSREEQHQIVINPFYLSELCRIIRNLF